MGHLLLDPCHFGLVVHESLIVLICLHKRAQISNICLLMMMPFICSFRNKNDAGAPAPAPTGTVSGGCFFFSFWDRIWAESRTGKGSSGGRKNGVV